MISILPWTFPLDISKEGMSLVVENVHSFNFAYCDEPHRKRREKTVFQFFLNSADATVWTCLLAATILVSHVIPMAIRNDGGVYWSGGSAMLATLSVLLTPGSSAQMTTAKHSMPFVLWMYTSIIFVTYYAGSRSSEITSAPVEARMKQIKEVFEKNYSHITYSTTRKVLGKLMESWLQESRANNKTSLTALHESSEMLEKFSHLGVVAKSV